MSIAAKRRERIERQLEGTGLVFDGHDGSYRIGRPPAGTDPERAMYHGISTTGVGFQTDELREAEAFAAGVEAAARIARAQTREQETKERRGR